MTVLKDLLEMRGKITAQMRELVDHPSGHGGDLSSDQSTRFDQLKGELSGVEKRIERQTIVDEAERRAQGAPITTTGDDHFDAEVRKFSLVRAIAGQVPDLGVDWGRERELGQELARRAGIKPKGIMVPTQVFEKRVITTAAPAAGPGSNLIATDLMGNQYFDRLRNALVIRRLGARVLSGLVGNVDIPNLKASATAGWVAENSALTPSDMQFQKASLTPKHAGCLTEFSRNMLQQSSPDIEELVRDDFAKVMAEAVDAVAIIGGGSNEPTGILATSGINVVAMGDNGLAPTWEKVLELVEALELDNAEGQGFLTNPKVVRKMRSTLKVDADAGAGFLMDGPNMLAGYPLARTNLVPSNLDKGTSEGVCSPLIFADWSDMLLGYWSAFELLVNPYESTAYAKGNVMVRGMLTMDVELRHAVSFGAIKDLLTT